MKKALLFAFLSLFLCTNFAFASAEPTLCGNADPDYCYQPTADAGMDQKVKVGADAYLDGSGTTVRILGIGLVYEWSFENWPGKGDGVEAPVFSDAFAVNPSFQTTRDGTYIINLTVYNDFSDPESGYGYYPNPGTDLVTVTTFGNAAPIADAGKDLLATPLASVKLDGSKSHDPDNDYQDLTFAWSVVQAPSDYSLTGEGTATPELSFEFDGVYVLKLVVTDPWGASGEDRVVVSSGNLPPGVDAGSPVVVMVGSEVELKGRADDPNNDPLTFQWSCNKSPAGNEVLLKGDQTLNLCFAANFPGTYIVQLAASDGLETASDTVQITVTQRDPEKVLLLAEEVAIKKIVDTAPEESFKHPSYKETLGNKMNAVISKTDQGNYQGAADQVANDILPKTDGSINSPGTGPDKNDWVRDEEVQELLYTPLIKLEEDLRKEAP